LRDRDVMNLLDQLELFSLKLGADQKVYWLYVYNTMKSGMLLTKQLEKHLHYKLEHLSPTAR
jgi:hypothetical protein